MTKGSVAGNMLAFAFPLMLANIFQQLYAVANSVVVGRQMGAAALAATGTAIPIVNVMVFLLLGVTMGSSVLMAEFFGAGDKRSLRDELSTSAAVGGAFTLALSAAGIFCAEPLLALIRTPRSSCRPRRRISESSSPGLSSLSSIIFCRLLCARSASPPRRLSF